MQVYYVPSQAGWLKPCNAMFSVNETQKHRAGFVRECLQQITPQQEIKALKAIGSSDRKLKRRVIQCLTDYQALCSPGKRGRKTRFGEDILEAAYDAVSNPGTSLYTGPTLRDKLVREGLMQLPVDTKNFLQHFEAYVRDRGQRLVTTSTGTIFCIHTAAREERVRWCKMVLERLQQYPIEQWVFEDETSIEEEPHPKCRYFMSWHLSN